MLVQMIRLLAIVLTAIFRLLLSSFVLIPPQASSLREAVRPYAIIINGSSSATSSPWLNKVANRDSRPRPSGCRRRPWICRKGEAPGTEIRCCRNRCVDVSSDVNNCGLCGITCPCYWQCCRGCCTNTNGSPFNCGRCGNRCPRGVGCTYGMCGYGQPWPRPQPRPPKPPKSCPPGGPSPPKR